MADTNLDPSIISVTNRAVAVASTASPRELLNISRIGPSLEQSENANLEITLNARALDLAPTATANELRSLGMAIGNLLEPQTERIFMDWRHGFIPDQRFADGQFLRTAGSHQKSWGGVTTTTLDELELVSVATGESLVYNSVSGKFENSTNTFAITVYATEADLPDSPLTGSLAYVTDASDVYYFDGSLWTIVQDVFSGIYRGNWQTAANSNDNSTSFTPFVTTGTVIAVDGTEATGGTTAGGSLDTTSRWASSVQDNQNSTSFTAFVTTGTVFVVDGTEGTGGVTVGGSVDTTNRWSSGNSKVYNTANGAGLPSWSTTATVLEVEMAQAATFSGTGTTNGGGFLYTELDQGFRFGPNKWTAECFIRPSPGGDTYQRILGTQAGGFSNSGWTIRTYQNKLQLWAGGAYQTGTTVLSNDTWYHIAVERDNVDFWVYIDGVREFYAPAGSVSDAEGITDSTFLIGGGIFGGIPNPTSPFNTHNTTPSELFKGAIGDVRLTEGNGLYNVTPFTRPSGKLEKRDDTRMLILRDGTFTDEADNPHTINQNDSEVVAGAIEVDS